MEKTIEKRSWGYFFLKKYVDFCFRRFYRVTYINSEKINTQEGSLFACNHQNALIDALAILTSFTWQPVFLARADIFRNKTLARILRFLKIIPVYRIRDGFDQLANNEQTFRETFRILGNNTPIALFPEGNHEGVKKIRSLKKGVARIAFSFLEEYPEKTDFRIIPVGLNYASYHEPMSSLMIVFGQPLVVSDFSEEYAANPAKAVNRLLEELKARLEDVSLHIENQEIYGIADLVCGLLLAKGKAEKTKPEVVFQAQKEAVTTISHLNDTNPSEMDKISQSAEQVIRHCEPGKINPEDFEIIFTRKRKLFLFKKVMLVILAFPFYLYSLLQNIITLLLINSLVGRIKDPQFKSSIFFTGSILVFPVIYLIQAVVVGILFKSFLVAGIYFLSLLPTFWIILFWEKKWIQLKRGIRLLKNLPAVQKEIEFILKYF